MAEQWTKSQIEQIIKTKEFQFVYSEKQVKEYYDQRKYAIVKHSQNLKELVQARKLPVNNEISNLKKGYYYIIDTEQQKAELKSQTQINHIAYALYRENKSDTYGNKICQINITNLVNGTFRPKNYPSEQINKATDLLDTTITILSVEDWDETVKARLIVWTTVQMIQTPEEIEEFEKLLNKPMTEDDDLQMQAAEFEMSQNKSILKQEKEELRFFDEESKKNQ